MSMRIRPICKSLHTYIHIFKGPRRLRRCRTLSSVELPSVSCERVFVHIGTCGIWRDEA